MKPLTIKEKQIFASELEMIFASGLGIGEGLQIMEANASSDAIKEVIHSLSDSFAQNQNFSSAIAQSQCFDAYMEQMVRIGEQSGHLDTVMKELSLYYKRLDHLRSQVQEACTYPFILIVLMIVIVAVMVFKVLPIFQDVLMQTGASTNALVQFGQVFGYISFVILLVLIISFALGFIVLVQKKNAQKSARFLATFFLTKKMYRSLSLGRFTYGLSLFVSGGYPIDEAIKMLQSLVAHPELSEKISAVQEDITLGKSFVESMLEHKIYDGIYANMLAIGLHTGQQDLVLKQLSLAYEEEVEASTSRFLNIIEPSIIALLSIIVGILLLSIMLPLLGILSILG